MMLPTLRERQVVALSIGPVTVHAKGEHALDLLARLHLEVLDERRNLDPHPNNALLRDVCPEIEPVAALMLMVLTHPGEASPIKDREEECAFFAAPRHFEPLTVGDLCVIVGAVHVQYRNIRVTV